MRRLLETTSSGNVAVGGYNKPISTIIKRTISITPVNTTRNNTTATNCPCKNLPGKVSCGICKHTRK